jgi:hypothetical protein
MNGSISMLDPVHDAGWDDRILAHGRGSFFLTSSWAKVLADSYGYRPRYFGEIRDGALATLLPFMEVSSFLTGKRAVSLPFTDQCEPIAVDSIAFQNVFESAVEQGKRCGWRYLELRPGKGLPGAIPCSTICIGHTLDLTCGADRLFAGLRDSTRRNIKRARGEGVRVTVSASPGDLQEFCRMNCMTRKDHGLPPQPRVFFDNMCRHVLSTDRGLVVLAAHKGRTVAGALYVHFGSGAMYKYGASDRRYQHLRANNLIMWESILWYASRGYGRFDFGRTEPENEGLLQFKRGWGADEHLINYYRYDLRTETFVAKPLAAAGAHTAYFRRMPMPLLKLAGTLLYRHVG